MNDPRLLHGQLPPIPEGCGILPIAENRIARGPHPELLDAVPDGYAPLGGGSAPPVLNDAMEQTYRRVLARALGLAACALLVASGTAASMQGASLGQGLGLTQGARVGQIVVRLIFVLQILFMGFLGRYVEKLGMVAAAVLLLAYAGFCGMEFSVLLPPATLAVGLACPALMYAATALWGYARGYDLARPATGIFMIVAGGVMVAAVNLALHTAEVCVDAEFGGGDHLCRAGDVLCADDSGFLSGL